ncbi:MAG: cytidylate kinase-like family protein [Lachnospiraceae bacterium]|nr:cytidylate kinase-like family protein [Lachnospiraceae bacterium]
MKSIITVGRQFGTGGHEIGQKLAEKLGIKCYDKDIIKRAAQESGLCHEILENNDERPTSSFLYNLVMDTYSFGITNTSYVDMPLSHKVFLAQFDTIKKIANEGPCVIVGRCADYALADYDNVLNLFIYGDMDKRISRVMNKYSVSEKDARDMIIKKDKQRASYYNYYSTKKWGKAETYNLCVDSTLLGRDGTVELLYQFVMDYEKMISQGE